MHPLFRIGFCSLAALVGIMPAQNSLAQSVSQTNVGAAAEQLHYEEYPTIRLRSLDKITARTLTFDAQVGTIIKFGDIYIKILTCRKPPPVEKTESAAFLQIWEVDKVKDQSRWIFSGWMFASSPALSAMDHPVYDVWVIDCLGKDPEEQLPPLEETGDKPLPDEGTVDADKAAPLPSAEPPQNQTGGFGDILDQITSDPPISQSPTQDKQTEEEVTPDATSSEQSPVDQETPSEPETTVPPSSPDNQPATPARDTFNGIY